MACDCENKSGEPRPGINTWGCGCNKMPEEPKRKGVVKFCDICDPCNETVSNVRLCAFVVPTLEEGRYYKNSFIFAQDEDAVYYISDDRSEIPFGSRPKFISDFDPADPEAKYKDAVVYDVKNRVAYIYGDDGERISFALAETPVTGVVEGDGITVTVNGGEYTVAVDETVARADDLHSVTVLATNHTAQIVALEGRATVLEADVADLDERLIHTDDVADTANELAVQARTEAQAAAQAAADVASELAGKQNTLTPGSNISIVNNEISATDTTYGTFEGTDGTGPGVAGLVPAPTTAQTSMYLKSDGTWAQIPTVVINDFVGTDGTSSGASGLVPAPVATDAGKFLSANGSWETIQAGGIPTDATFWGQTYDATSNSVNGNINFPVNNSTTYSIIKTYGGRQSRIDFLTNNTIAVAPGGTNVIHFVVLANTEMGILLDKSINSNGHGIYAYGSGAAFGSGIYPDGNNLRLRANNAIYVERASGTGNNPQIKSVADPTAAQDAATKNYVDSIYPVGAVCTSTSATAPTIAGGTWTEIGTQTIGSSTVHYYERTA